MRSVNKYPLAKSNSYNFSRLLKSSCPKKYSKKTWYKKSGTRESKSKINKTDEPKSKQEDNLEKYFSKIRAAKREEKTSNEKSKSKLNEKNEELFKSYLTNSKLVPFVPKHGQLQNEMPNSRKTVSSLESSLINSHKPEKSHHKAPTDKSTRIDIVFESYLQKYDEKPLEWRVTKIGNELLEYCNAKFVDEEKKSKRDAEIQTSLCEDVNKSLEVFEKRRDTKHVETLSSKRNDFFLNIPSPLPMKPQVIQSRDDHLFGQPLESDFMENFMTNTQTATLGHDFFSFNNLSIEPRTTSVLDIDELGPIPLRYTKLEDLY